MASRYEQIRLCRQLNRALRKRRDRANTEPYSQRRLAIVVSAVSERLRDVRVPGMTANLAPLLEVSGAFVQGCLDAGRGVLAMSRAKEHGGIVAAERSAWELWNELDYLLRRPDPPMEAVKVQVNALLELTSWLKKQEHVSSDVLKLNEDGLGRFKHEYPEIVRVVEEQRKKSRFHWSGQKRSKIVGPTAKWADVYKLLSWETHPDILSIRDVESTFEDGYGVLTLNLPDDALILALRERSASSTSECLLRCWNAFAQFWMQQEIEFVPPRKFENRSESG
jgi:hypothetical protein